MAKAKLLGKRKPEGDLETKPILKKHKKKSDHKETAKGFVDSLQQIKGKVKLLETKSDHADLISVKEAAVREKTLFIDNLSLQTQISHIIDFFKNVGQVVHVRLIVDHRGKLVGCGFAEFVSANEAKKALEKKNGGYLHDHKIFLDVANKGAQYLPLKNCMDHKVCYEDYLRRESLPIEEDETPPGFVEAVAVRKKTLFVAHLSRKTEKSHIIGFFKDVGEVVHVRLILNHTGKHLGCGFVEFADANEAKKALEKKNGEYLDRCKILLKVATIAPYPPPKYCIDHKVWYKDYLRRESLPIKKDETPPDFVEEVLFVANLSPQTKIFHIFDFFNYVGEVVSVRLIVNHEGKHVGYGFVEFASANEATKALEKKNGEYLHDHKIFLDVAKTAPYSPRPKYNFAEMLCYEDYLRRESLPIEKDETPPGFVEAVAVRKKTLFVAHLSRKTEISHIIKFFKDVGEVVHVRLILNHTGKHVGCGFVKFADANEAKKALEKKNGEYLNKCKILLEVAKNAPYPPPKYCIDHKVWYEDYLRQESLLIEEDEAVEGLDETPVLVEEVAVRKKTLFVANLSHKTKSSQIINFFNDVGEVVHVRLIVDHMGEHVGCGFVEFASANEAKEVLRKKNGETLRHRKIFLDVAEIAPYPLRPKYNLAERLWCERESLLKKQKARKVAKFCGKKTIFSYDDDD